MTQPNELNPDSSPSSLSRRFLLGAGASAVAALAIPSAAKAQTPSPTPSPTCTPLPPNPNPPCQPSRPFSEPKVVSSQNQEAKLTLDAVQIPIDIPGTTINDLLVRTYNAQLSGPSIYVNPGDKISITLNNQLSTDNPYCDQSNLGHNSPSCFNTTNMHFHGLHVSPSSICKNGHKILSSDDVLYEVAPQKTHEWCVWLPQFHAPGTHWYHAHRHGATGIQVSNGMAGAIIIQEPIENRIVEPADDKLWLIQEVVQIPESCQPPDNQDIFTDAALYWLGVGRNTGTFLVNGTYQPTLTIPSGRIQRWRFINGTATPRGLMNLYLQKVDNQCNPIGDQIPMYLMAVDGISFYGKKPQQKNNWNMSSGNRADFLISLPSGKYCVYKDNYTGQGGPGSNPDLGESLSFKQALAYIDVYQSVEYPDNRWQKIINNPIPGEFPDYLKPIQKTELVNPDKPQKVVFFINPGQSKGPNRPKPPSDPGGNPGGYLIGNNSTDTANFQPYQMNCVDYKVKLNTSEVWTLENAGKAFIKDNKGTGSAHPFHIHVNPFQIASEANKIDLGGPNDSSNWIWWDTIAVEPGKTPIEIWHRFSDYPGEFVIHCHILIHEDQGMMKNVVVVGEGAGPCVPLPNPNHVLPPGPTCPATNNPSCSTPTSSPQPTSSASPSPQPGSGGGGGRGTGGGGGGGQGTGSGGGGKSR